MKEEVTIQKLEEAIKLGMHPCEVDDFVGTPSIMNTCREEDREIIEITDFGPDPAQPDQFHPPSAARNVAYWPADPGDKPARIVGIYWKDENNPVLFRAVVYPP